MLCLALVFAIQPVPVFTQATSGTVESRVEEALVRVVRERFGTAANVRAANVQVSVRESRAGSIAVTPSPAATLGGPIEFVVIGTGSNGRPTQIGRGHADITVVVPHAQATRTIARGSVLGAADVLELTAEPGRVPLKRLPTARELTGAKARRDIGSGEVLTLAAAALPPAVRAGETVQGVASVGPVRVVAELTAVDNGATGSIVRVVNRDTRRELRARVVGEGVVEVIHE